MPVEWISITERLKFRREFDGRVVLRMDGEQTYISAEKWVSVVASLSFGGDQPETHSRIRDIHGVGLADGKRSA